MTKNCTIRFILTLFLVSTFDSVVIGQFYVDPETGDRSPNGEAILDDGGLNYPQLLLGDVAILEMVADQRSDLNEKIRLIGIANHIAGQDYNNGKTTALDFRDTIVANENRVSQIVSATLLPFQLNELKRIAFLDVASKNTLPSLIEKDSVSKFLGLSQDEKKRMKKKAADIQKELEEKVMILKREAQRELLSELPQELQLELGFDLK